MQEGDPGRTAQAADRIMAINRRWSAQHARLRQCPFGLAPGSWQPSPARLGPEAFGISSRAVLAFMVRRPVPRSSMTLVYGDEEDLSAVLVEVTTDFTRSHKESLPLEDELGRAAFRDVAAGRAASPGDHLTDDEEFDGPFDNGITEILVEGTAQRVPILGYQEYQAFRFQGGCVVVTVVTRHHASDRLSFARLAELDPYIGNFDNDDAAVRDAIQQRIREATRRTPHTP